MQIIQSQTTVLSIDDITIEVDNGQGGTFQINRNDLKYIAEEGHTERQYLVYQIAVKLVEMNVDLDNTTAVAQAIGDMTINI